jgi:putative FmdB family regulatory protein
MGAMPTYDYRATEEALADANAANKDCPCREGFETVQRMAEEPLTACPECGGPIQRVINAVGFSTKSHKTMMSDANLKKNGFKKLVKEGDGKYRNVLA